MSSSPAFAALAQTGFLLYCASRFFAAGGMTLQQVAINWQVYEISDSPLHLGLIGLARFVPSFAAGLYGGVIADTRDRRTILIYSQLAPLAVSMGLLALTLTGTAELWNIYALVVILGLASAFEGPARQALLPQIVSRETFAGAVTFTSTISQFAFVLGPAAAGWAIAASSVAGAYGVHIGVQAAAVISIAILSVQAGTGRTGGGLKLALIKEGLLFVKERPVLWGVMALDLFAVIFAGAQSLLPVYARDILDVGSEGYGWLTASQAVGAFVMSVLLFLLPPIRRTGRAMILTVLAFGVFTVVFGLSRWYPLSLAAYALRGAADQISVVMRQATIQLATPDELRGRVSSVNMVFIGASNHLGSVQSGLTAAITNATFAVVAGGAGCIGTLALVWAKVPELWRYDTRDAGSER